MTTEDVRAARAHLVLCMAGYPQSRRIEVTCGDVLTILDDHARLAAESHRLRAEVDALIHEGTPDAVAHLMTRAARAEAEVERLTSERDFYRGERDAHYAIQMERTADRDRLAAALAERSHLTHAAGYAAGAASMRAALDESTAHVDRLLAALTEVREAASAAFPIEPGTLDHGRIVPPEKAGLLRAIGAIPADLAATHDARVRTEALRDAAMVLGGAEPILRGVASWLRSRADEIERGGR